MNFSQGEQAMYYIEGSIDAIETSGANPGRIRFSLIPTSERILSRDGGKKKALFTDSSSPSAIMVDPDKNAAGKEIVWFHAEEHLCNIILSAKNNRNTIWVWCDHPEAPDLDDKEPIPPISTIKAKGIRVFSLTGGRPIDYNDFWSEAMDESDKIKLKFEAIWKARQIEMESFSARALYIWGFLALCYGAYAYLLYQAVSTFLLPTPRVISHLVGAFNTFNGLLMVVAIGIFIISILWICMIKGANAWAERTDWLAENYTHVFLRTDPVEDSCCAKQALGGIRNRRNCKKCNGNPCHECLLGLFPYSAEFGYFPKRDKSLTSPNGGAYSPNKVYLFIAQISMWIGATLTICHAIVAIVSFEKLKIFARWLSLNHWIVGAVPLLLLLSIIIVRISERLRERFAQRLESMALNDDMAVFRAIHGE